VVFLFFFLSEPKSEIIFFCLILFCVLGYTRDFFNGFTVYNLQMMLMNVLYLIPVHVILIAARPFRLEDTMALSAIDEKSNTPAVVNQLLIETTVTTADSTVLSQSTNHQSTSTVPSIAHRGDRPLIII